MKLDAKNLRAEISKNCCVAGWMSPREYLRAVFECCKKTIPSFTHKDFSEFLGFSASNNLVRLVISGHRVLTAKVAKTIAQGLGLKHAERRYFLLMVDHAAERIPAAREELMSKLIKLRKEIVPNKVDEMRLDFFDNWYNPVLSQLLKLERVTNTPEGMQNSLAFPLRLDEIKRSLELLQKLGIVRLNPKNKQFEFVDDDRLWFEDNENSMAITRFHQKMLEVAHDSITRLDNSQRTIETMTLTLSKESVLKLNESIEQVIQKAFDLESADSNPTDLYQMNIQLFALTKPGED